ncbi:GNAT family N-acetyltransferase [Streptomyces sp. TRM 70361]|uniref:GNAT family N-acetyltransferase n=1 Tax=Streptomyces sp. TRM 70361 TaxID=3116553 RepID=UPI002E7C06C8|nr:GNAT family N-acetyltransferase [Streptomyces sp. TRM 70361]MEE1942518.1 GNAT family N-acetyltransferase [Streptomyces sp. TRM 70361]
MSASVPARAPQQPLIRPAAEEDGAALGELDRRAWSPLHAVLPRPRPPYDPFFDSTHRPREFLLAESGGRLVGYVRLVRAGRLAAKAHVRTLQGLVVDDRARGRGVGRALVRAAPAEARRQGASRVALGVLGHSAPARARYASEGFAVEGVLPGEFLLETGFADGVLMGRSLGAAAPDAAPGTPPGTVPGVTPGAP